MKRTAIAVLVIAGTLVLAPRSYADPVRTHEVVRRDVSGDPDDPSGTTPLVFRNGDPEDPSVADHSHARPRIDGTISHAGAGKLHGAPQPPLGGTYAGQDGGSVAWWFSWVMFLRRLLWIGP
ncbi:MAG: hypothetical protein U0167_17355 [bacterium]